MCKVYTARLRPPPGYPASLRDDTTPGSTVKRTEEPEVLQPESEGRLVGTNPNSLVATCLQFSTLFEVGLSVEFEEP